MRKKPILLSCSTILLCLILMFSITGCATTSDAPSPSTSDATQKKDSMTVVIKGDPANFDPNVSGDQFHFQVTNQIYETLFIYDEDYKLTPWLCESYEYEDPSTIIMHIRQGVKFSNGDELKASDVLFSLNRIKRDHHSSDFYIGAILLDKSEVLDEYTLKIVTDGPAATLLNRLQSPHVGIFSQRSFEEAGDPTQGTVAGTGPYIFSKYYPGDRVILTANDNYWVQGQPAVKNVTFRIITDTTGRANEALSGGADIVYGIGANDIDRLKADGNLDIVSVSGTNTTYLLFNLASEPLADPLVREAIWYGIDREATVRTAYKDYGKLAAGWACPGIGGGDPNISSKFVKRDVQKAKDLLAQAGYPNGGLSLRICVNSDNKERGDMAQAMQAQLGEIGIDLQVDVMEVSAWLSQLAAGEHQLTLYGMSCTSFEVDTALGQHMPGQSGFTLCHFDNKEFQDTVAQAAVTIDLQERHELYYKAQNTLVDNYLTLPLWHNELTAAVKKDVSGFNIDRAYEQLFLRTVTFK